MQGLAGCRVDGRPLEPRAGGTSLAETIVSNPGFETGSFTGSWSLTGGDTNIADVYVGAIPNAPHTGCFAAQLGPTSLDDLTQNLATTSGDTYTLSFYYIGTGFAGPPNNF